MLKNYEVLVRMFLLYKIFYDTHVDQKIKGNEY